MSIKSFNTINEATTFQLTMPGSVIRYNGCGADILSGSDIPADIAPPLITVDSGCLKAILASDGLLTSINTYVSGLSTGVQILWANTNLMNNKDSLILAWATQCVPPKSQADINNYFTRAVALQATL